MERVWGQGFPGTGKAPESYTDKTPVQTWDHDHGWVDAWMPTWDVWNYYRLPATPQEIGENDE